MSPRFGWTTAAMATLILACASPESPPPATSGVSVEIVNGNNENGHPAVGAMTFEVQGQYGGSFCTGTLIAPRWVLTAAHCTEGVAGELAQQGINFRDDFVYFYIGTDARPVNRQRPDGDFYQAREVFLHPRYTGADLLGLFDIALVELVDPVEGVDPYSPLASGGAALAGDDMLYVGFGVSDGVRQRGGGVKRSVALEVDAVYDTMYVSNHDNNGVCFGDSGGPGLVQIGGQWQVFGVNSSVAGEPVCLNQSLQTRVDAYITWIRDTMGEAVNCRAGGADACLCADACRPDGVCDNGRCGEACGDTADCVSRCQSQACFTECLLTSSAYAVRSYGEVISCGQARCNNVADFNACIEDRCPDEVAACFDDAPPVDPPDPGDGLSCLEVLECLQGCDDQQCGQACFTSGTADAQRDYDALYECSTTICGNFDNPEAYHGCMAANCGDEWLACAPSDNCRVTGGDCPAGEGCRPGLWGGTYCDPTGDAAPGDACDPDARACRDGAYCVPSPAGGTCAPMCVEDGDCPNDGICELFGTPEPAGVCLGGEAPCVDADDDGVCADDDCDDGDPATYPGADEICGDGDDQDCDDSADEGCPDPGCTDRDGDGTCADDDCDDADPESYPGARELCGDDVDQDCDDASDEGCDPACVDNDGDGVCRDEDCNDGDPGRRPGLDEICGDAIDQDCDGSTDEGCPACEDGDGDGVCVELDCADDNPAAYPGAGEQCGNGVDEDCDDATDEGCEGCVDADGDGFCADADCDDADPEVGGPGPGGCDGGCIDGDGDGLCLADDCDDADPAAGAPPCISIIDADGGVEGAGGGVEGGGDDGDGGGGGGTVGCYCDVGTQRGPGGEAVLLLIGLIGWRRRRG